MTRPHSWTKTDVALLTQPAQVIEWCPGCGRARRVHTETGAVLPWPAQAVLPPDMCDAFLSTTPPNSQS